jgi:hypothetical protein
LTKLMMKRKRKEEWAKYVNSINHNTQSSQIWAKIRRLSGKTSSHKITRLRDRAGNTTEAAQEIANKLARHFVRNSSTANYNTRFQKYKERVEKNPPNIQLQHEAGYNNPLIMEELLKMRWKAAKERLQDPTLSVTKW